MRLLSYILALWVMLLATSPCFLEDKCLFKCVNDMQEDAFPNDDGTSCTNCCSPFLHCNTCTGFLVPKLYHSSFVIMIQLNDNQFLFYTEKLISLFLSDIWQPPKFMDI